MKRRIRFAAIAVMASFVASADVWPDGSKMDVWFADRSPVDETRLGRLRRTEEFGAKPDKEEMQTAILQRAIDTIAAEGGGVLVFGFGAWNTSSLFFKPGVHLKLEKGGRTAWTGRRFGGAPRHDALRRAFLVSANRRRVR